MPAHFEDLLSQGAHGYALQAYAAYAIDRLQLDYRYAGEKAAEDARGLLSDFWQQLKKLGRHGRIRPSSLYLPAMIRISRTTDFF